MYNSIVHYMRHRNRYDEKQCYNLVQKVVKRFFWKALRKVTTKVCFQEPLYYEEYQKMTTQEISMVVKKRIEECMVYLEGQKSGKSRQNA